MKQAGPIILCLTFAGGVLWYVFTMPTDPALVAAHNAMAVSICFQPAVMVILAVASVLTFLPYGRKSH